MSLQLAQARAWDLATTLMVCVVLVSVDGQYGVLEASEFDGDPAAVVQLYDPFSA